MMILMNLDEVCETLKISVQTGRNRISLGLPMPPSFRAGRRRLFLRAEVENWIRRLAAGDSPDALNLSKGIGRDSK